MSAPSDRHARNAASIARACAAIERDLTGRHRIADLARDSGMAQHHFQRRFAAVTGETVAGYLRARRLERAAIALSQADARILDIALDCGFETHAALTRAFKAHFGTTPDAFRRDGLDPALCGAPPRPFLRPVEAQSFAMACDLMELPEQWLCWRRATGMIDGRYFPDLASTQAAFDDLARVLGKDEAAFAAGYAQGPAAFEDQSAVAHFGALFDTERGLAWAEGRTRIEAGLYAIFPHRGPLNTLHLTWHRAARVGLGRLNLRLRPGWMVETYLTSRIEAPGAALSALIHLPVHKSTIGKA